MAREARPLLDRVGPERDDDGNLVERAFLEHGEVLLACFCGCGLAWLEPAAFYREDPDPAEAPWRRPRELGETYWLFGATLH